MERCQSTDYLCICIPVFSNQEFASL